jgi:UDP-glucuronate 4-epimerase
MNPTFAPLPPSQMLDRSALVTEPRPERFLVTGCEGCIGSWVVRRLLASGETVVATDLAAEPARISRIVEAPQLDRLVYASADLTEPGTLERLIAEHGVTRIVHLAALQVPYVAANPVAGAEINVVGTTRVLEAARRGESVRGVAYASSSAVYGTDGTWGRAETLYGAFKAANEETARFYARDYETPSVGLRPCVVYGPNRDRGMTAAITHAIKAAVLGREYTVPFEGIIDLQYADDVAAAFIAAALVEQPGAPVFDLQGDMLSVATVLDALEQALPGTRELISIGSAAVPGRVEFDDAPLQALVGELPKTSIADGVAASVELFRRQRESGELTEQRFAADAGLTRSAA